MRRTGLGLIAGALAAIGAIILDQQRLPLLALLLAVAAGLLAGALVGWRTPRPGVALLQGGLAGLLAGAPLALVVWCLGIHLSDLSGGPLAQSRLTEGMALACALLCVALGATCAGLISGWTGYGQWSRQARRTRGIANVGQQPARAQTTGPLGPAPRIE